MAATLPGLVDDWAASDHTAGDTPGRDAARQAQATAAVLIRRLDDLRTSLGYQIRDHDALAARLEFVAAHARPAREAPGA